MRIEEGVPALTGALVDMNLDTPALVIDAQKMEQNILGMADVAESLGVVLRPHVKTHKIPSIARRQTEVGAAGITGAKISEAEVMADGGLDDIFIAYPLVTETKIRRAIGLAKKGVRLILGVDSQRGARKLSSLARDEGITLEVRLEVDSGLGRTGVPRAEAAGLAQEISALENLNLTGVYTYRGAVLEDGSPTTNLNEAGRLEGKFMVSVAEEIRDAGGADQGRQSGFHPDRGTRRRGRGRHGDQTRHLRLLRQDAGRVGCVLAPGLRPTRGGHRGKQAKA